MDIDLSKLKTPFPPAEIEWRIAQAGKTREGSIWAKVLAYITNRAIMDRLDEVVGPENWRNEYQFVSGGVLCGLSVRINGEWVTKWDGADPSDIEAFKGSLSGAMKRAAVQFGIGRYLYDLGESWAVISEQGAHYANCKIKHGGKEEYVNFKWDHPRLPAWAIPEGTVQKTVAKIEEETNGAVQRVDEKKLSPNQKKTQSLQKLIVEATDEDALTNIAQLCKAAFDGKEISKNQFEYLQSSGRNKRESLKSMDKLDERFGGPPAIDREYQQIVQ